MTEPKKISTILANGTKVEYDVILTFHSRTTNKNYVIYTDNTHDLNHRLRFYAATYDKTAPIPYLGEPTTAAEWNEITATLNQVIPQSSI